jgi:citrate synthase
MLNLVNLDRRINVKLVTAREAAEALGVSLNTLYAYVSRGLLQSHSSPGARTRVYRWDEVERLRDRKRKPEEISRKALTGALRCAIRR